MTKLQHPLDADLAEYLEHPTDEASAHIRLHLASCPMCRRSADALDTLESALIALRDTSRPVRGSGHLTDQGIAEYILAEENDPVRQTWQSHVAECGSCREAVLLARARERKHQRTTPNHAVQDHVAAFPNTNTTAEITAPIAAAPKVPAARVTPPRWRRNARIPLAAAAGFLLAVALLPRLPALFPPPALQLAAYRDDPGLHFGDEEQPQGLGFFTGATVRSEPYAGVHFDTKRNGDVTAQWSPIAKATEYRFRIFGLNDSTPVAVLDVRTGGTSVAVPSAALQPGKRYEWQVSGTTTEGSHFSTSGGFVVFPRDEK